MYKRGLHIELDGAGESKQFIKVYIFFLHVNVFLSFHVKNWSTFPLHYIADCNRGCRKWLKNTV